MHNLKLHFNELRLKCYYIFLSFFLTFITSYFFSSQLINVLSYPLLQFVKTEEKDFICTNIFEVFNTYIVLAYYITFFFNIPLALYFIFTFIKPGLFIYEKFIFTFMFKVIMFFVCLSLVFTYYFIFPYLLSFLFSLDLLINTNFLILKIETKIYDYISFLCNFLLFYCFIIFQIPSLFCLVIYFTELNLFSIYNKRRLWILFSFIIGCIFSPPDLISLFVICLPLLFFFEFALFTYILRNNYKQFYFSFIRELLER